MSTPVAAVFLVPLVASAFSCAAARVAGPGVDDPTVNRCGEDLSCERERYAGALRAASAAKGPESPEAAALMAEIGLLERDFGDLPAARKALDGALAIFRKTGGETTPAYGKALVAMGSLLKSEGDYSAARTTYEKALAILSKGLGDAHPDVATALDRLGEVQRALGDLTAARVSYVKALDIRKKAFGGDHKLVAWSENNMGSVLRDMGEFLAAEPHFVRAIEIRRKVFGPMNKDLSISLNSLGKLQLREGRLDEAQKNFTVALEIREKVLPPDHPYTAYTRHYLGEVCRLKGDLACAAGHYNRAIESRTKTLGPEHIDASVSTTGLALSTWAQGDAARAADLFVRAGAILNTAIARVLPSLSFAEQRAFVDTHVPALTSALISSARERPRLEAAYSTLFRWKGLLLESLRRHTTVARAELDAACRPTVGRLHAARARVAGWYQRAGTMPYSEWRAGNDALTAEKEAIERELAACAGMKQAEDPLGRVDLAAFRGLLAKDEVFADIYRYGHWDSGRFEEERYAAILLGAAFGPVLVDFGPAAKTDRAVKAWLSDASADLDAAERWDVLSARLWHPIEKALPGGAAKLLVSADGELSRIPWHLFPRRSEGKGIAMVAHVDSPRILAALRKDKGAKTRPAKPGFFMAGGIDFDAGGTAPGARGKPAFPDLPGTQKEIEALEVLVRRGGADIVVLRGDQPSKAATVLQMGRATHVHLATHGFFAAGEETPWGAAESAPRAMLYERKRVQNARNPLVESGIALAGANSRGGAEREAVGILTAEEIVGLDLARCELVTLSACETGRGESVTGQGVMGLRASITAAGARSVLMSLWQVPDEATVKLMEHFYRNLLEKKVTKAEALAKAQEAVRDDSSGRYRNPFHWAAWVLAGEAW
jgi:CHAT domain-containing protein/tetratricopeptide (TPR) repeat protein